MTTWYINKILFLQATFLDPFYFIFISFFIYFFGLISFIRNETDLLKSFLCLELLYLSCSFNFIIFSYYTMNIYGQIYALFILSLAAIDSSVGLSLIILRFKHSYNVVIKNMVVTSS